MSLQKTALNYLKLGLNPVPVGSDKAPLREGHSTVKMTKEEIKDYDFENIGISTGIISGGLEAIDFDLKNADDPDLVMEIFKSKVPLTLLNRLVVQQTISGGFHMIYRCLDVSSSKKLAKSSEGKAIIETRGEGGYIKCAPSDGYTLIQGDFSKIPIIEPEERLQLFISAKMLSETIIKDAKKRRSAEDNQYVKKFPEFNGDEEYGLEILENHGWVIKTEDSEWFNMSRPNSKSGDIHGGYHKDGKFFFNFSTAVDNFETEKPYNNHAIFAELECDGRYDVAYAKLYEDGYGVGTQSKDKKKMIKKAIDEDWEKSLETLSFLSDTVEETDYLEQARKGQIEQGKKTGWEDMDEYMRFKDNSFNFGLGYDGVGKSIFMLSMAVASNTLHDWKWGMIMPENKTAMSRRRLIECESGKQIIEFRNRSEEFDRLTKKSREQFKIMSNQKHYSLDDVIDMGKRLYEYHGINALLIDPYNFFRVEGNGYNHNNEILSKLRVFAEQYCSVYVMAHPRSDAPRMNKDPNGYLKAPSKYDIQGGADFSYRVDDFFIIHRIRNHQDPDIRKTMQFTMEKVKEEETGGKVHNSDEWSELIWERRNGFLGYWDTQGNNPMYKAYESRLGVRAKMKLKATSPEEAFGL